MNSHRQVPLLSVVLALLLPAVLRGQECSPAPVPSEMLRDGELVVESHNFAVRTPAGDWQWFLIKRQRGGLSLDVYLCEEAGSGAQFQVACMGVRRVIDARCIQGFEDGVKESLAAGRMKLVSMQITDSPVPVPHSYRGQWHALLADGQSLYGYAYLVASETLLDFDHVTTEATEPPEFLQFVNSFRPLHAWRSRPENRAVLVLMGYLLLLGLACEIASIVNRAHGKVVLNGGTLGAIFMLVMMIILIIAGNWAAISVGSSAEKVAQTPEYRVGQALIPLLVAVLVSRSFRKRRMREEKMPGETRPPIS